MLEAHRLTKWYGGLRAVADVSFTLGEGEVSATSARTARARRRRWACSPGSCGPAPARSGSASKGMRQKVLIAPALLHDPPPLVFDEPPPDAIQTLGLEGPADTTIRAAGE